MIKQLKQLGILLLLILLSPVPVFALETTSSAENVVTGDMVTQEADQVIENDYFAAGDDIELMGKVQGDAALAGSIIDVSGIVEGDLLAAGGTVIVSGDIAEDARIAGGKVHISGTFGKNLWIAGGQVTISEDVEIGGSLIVMGGIVTVRGSNNKDVRIFGADLFYGGTSSSNVYLEGDMVEVGKETDIAGNLQYVYGTDVRIAEEIQVTGEITAQTVDEKYPDGSSLNTQEWFFNDGAFNVAMLIMKFINYVSVLVIGMILILLFPRICPKVVEKMNNNAGNALLIGIFSLPIFITVIIFLTLTLVGIPLVLLLTGLALIFTFMSKIFVAIWIGNKLFVYLNREKMHDMWSLLVGMFIYELLTMIPFIGWFFAVVAISFGMGAILIAINEQRIVSK